MLRSYYVLYSGLYLSTFSMIECNRCCSFCNCFSADCNRSLSSVISLLCVIGSGVGLLCWTAGTTSAIVDGITVTYSGCLLCQWLCKYSPFINVFGHAGHCRIECQDTDLINKLYYSYNFTL